MGVNIYAPSLLTGAFCMSSRTYLTGWTFWALKPELPASPRHVVRTRRGDVQGGAMADEDSIEVASVTIRKLLTSNDYEISVDAVDEQGDELALIDTLGLLEFAKMATIRDWADADPGEDDEQ